MSAIYNGIRILVDPKTGEKIPVRNVIKTAPMQDFRKMQIMDFLISLNIIGGKSIKVYSYVLKHMGPRSNKLYQTNKQIKAGLEHEGYKVSLHTIMRVLSKLERTKDTAGNYLLSRKRYGKYGKHSYLMLDPKMTVDGSKGHADGLLLQYNNMDKPRKHHSKHSGKSSKARSKKKHHQQSKARKAKEARDKRRGWTTDRAEAKRLGIGYQTKIKFGKNKKAVKD